MASSDVCSICLALEAENRVRVLPSVEYDSAYIGEPMTRHCWDMFHRHDPNCDSCKEPDPGYSNSLCIFCRHFRFDHPYASCTGVCFEIFLDSPIDIQSRQHTCSFCSLVTKTLARSGLSYSGYRLVLQYVSSRDHRREWSRDKINYRPRISVSVMDENGKRFPVIERGGFERANPISRSSTQLEPLVGGQVDWSNIRERLQQGSPPTHLDPHPQDFRVIDVENDCLIRAPKGCAYVALSYVWGETKRPFAAKLSNIQHLGKPGSLQHISLPETIRDAIQACAQLDQKYLWIDRLCIPQDEHDNPTKALHIKNMNRIYSHASATIVAAEGFDADFGLYGVSKRERITRYCSIFKNIAINEMGGMDPASYIKSRPWNSRGWTYQEAMFSPRLLFFTAYGVIAEQAGGGNWFENDFHRGLSSLRWGTAFYLYSDYAKVIEHMFCRAFSREEDVLDASLGIFQEVYGNAHRFGLPLREFDSALLWFRKDASARRRRATERRTFPTWSWSSICGHVEQAEAIDGESVATWAFLETGAFGTRRVVFPYLQYRERRYISWIDTSRTIMIWKNGFMRSAPPRFIQAEENTHRAYKIFQRHWPTQAHFWEASRGFGTDQGGSRRIGNEFHPDVIQAASIPRRAVIFAKRFFHNCRTKAGPWDLSRRSRGFIEEFTPQQIQEATLPGRAMALAQVAVLSLVAAPEDELEPGMLWVHDGIDFVGAVTLDTDAAVESFRVAKGKSVDMAFLALCVYPISDRDKVKFPGFNPETDHELESLVVRSCEDDPNFVYGVKALAVENTAGVYRRLGLGTILLKRWLEKGPKLKAVVLA